MREKEKQAAAVAAATAAEASFVKPESLTAAAAAVAQTAQSFSCAVLCGFHRIQLHSKSTHKFNSMST